MSEHYYSHQPQTASRLRTVQFEARGVSLQLETDAGVFSKSGLDFGTRLLLEAVELRAQANVVDLGCGYGPVAAVLGRVYTDSRWLLIDVNERALDLANRNTRQLAHRAQYRCGDGFRGVVQTDFTDVITNPPIRAGKAVIYRLFDEACAHLQRDGRLWLVIQKKQGAPSAEKFLKSCFGHVQVRGKKSGYYVFCCDTPLARPLPSL